MARFKNILDSLDNLINSHGTIRGMAKGLIAPIALPSHYRFMKEYGWTKNKSHKIYDKKSDPKIEAEENAFYCSSIFSLGITYAFPVLEIILPTLYENPLPFIHAYFPKYDNFNTPPPILTAILITNTIDLILEKTYKQKEDYNYFK